MTSVYFPSHVFLLFRRLVNVVSTLSISNHCISHPYADGAAQTHKEGDVLNSLGDYPRRLEVLATPGTVECSQNWPWLLIRQTWDSALLGTMSGVKEMGNTLYLRNLGGSTSAPDIPNWVSGPWTCSWPTLFSSPPPEIQPESDPTPPGTRTSSSSSPQSTRGEKEPLNDETSKPRQAPVNFPMPSTRQEQTPSPDIIHQLLANPALYDPIRTPRFPIILSHGLYGFDTRGPISFPSMRMHYWSNVLRILRGVIGAEVIVTAVPGTGSITSRADRLHEQLKSRVRGRGINFLAHSMGGLDCRHLISHISPKEYVPLSLTTIGTPHRGSPFMDWCTNNIGIGTLRQQEKELEELRKSGQRSRNSSSVYGGDDVETYSPPEPKHSSCKAKLSSVSSSHSSFSFSSLPSSFTTLLLSIVDSPAYANLTSTYLTQIFNPATPDDPRVKYWSVAGRVSGTNISIWHPFWLPKMILDGWEESERVRLKEGGLSMSWEDEREWGNDGLVTVQSAKWGDFLGIMEGCDHWEMRGSRGIEFGVDLPALPAFGLGKSPHPTSTVTRPGPVPSSTGAAQQAQGDGWGFGDWMRFVGAWKKSESDDAAVAAKNAGVEEESRLEKDKRERRREEEAESALKISADKMSVVFDWLIERVPAPTIIRPPGSKDENVNNMDETIGEKVIRTNPVTFTVGSSSPKTTPTSQQSSSNPKSPLAEIKYLMEGEHKQRAKKTDLASREDLERFYVALAKRMWDSGL